VLAIVAWNMVEKHAFATLLRASRGDAVVLLATFLLTIFRDLAHIFIASADAKVRHSLKVLGVTRPVVRFAANLKAAIAAAHAEIAAVPKA
jgi:MFS superfamily sulfate permease-like transporter